MHLGCKLLMCAAACGTLLSQEAPQVARVNDVVHAVTMVQMAAGSQKPPAIPDSARLAADALKQKAAALLLQAQSTPAGIASEVLLKRPESNIQMAVRVKSGQGEWHRDDADILIGVEGSAQIITGGEIVNGKETAPGEIRGDGVRGGTTQPFRAGDFIRIEPKVAHQVLLAPGSTFRYMAVKVRVTPQ